MAGRGCGSWGYHSNNGAKYWNTGEKAVPYAEKFRTGDTVGCGIKNGELYFTKNGRHLGTNSD